MKGGAIGNVTATPDLIQMAMAYSRSRVVCAAARLGIADALGDEEHSVEELAEACGADAPSLHRLLRALAILGITSEVSPGRFVLTPFGQPLRKDASQSAWAGVVFWGDLLADNWSRLTECVQTGRTAADLMQEEGVQSRWSKYPGADAIFRKVMGSGPAENYMPIATRWSFQGQGTVADLGGGGGTLLAAILSTDPQLQGLLVDRPASIEAARPRFETSELRDRCRLIAADLGEEVPAGAEVYMLKHVLHGYKDAAALEILTNCRKAVPRDGRLLVIEFVLPEVVSGPDPALEHRLMSDLNMMAVTGGKERTLSEWKRLFEPAGFKAGAVVPVPELDVSIIEAVPA